MPSLDGIAYLGEADAIQAVAQIGFPEKEVDHFTDHAISRYIRYIHQIFLDSDEVESVARDKKMTPTQTSEEKSPRKIELHSDSEMRGFYL